MSAAPTVLRLLALTLAWLAAASGAALLTLGLVPAAQASSVPAAMASAFVPHGVVAWLVATLLFVCCARGRLKLAALATTLGLAAQASWLVPYVPHAAPPAVGTPLRVLAINLYFGRADGAQLTDLLRRVRPDVVVLVEYSAEIDATLTRTGIKDAYPHRVGRTPPNYAQAGRWDASGTQVWSRTPLTDLGAPASTFDQPLVRVQRPAGPPVVVAAVHPVNMVYGVEPWQRESEALAQALRPHLGEPLLAIGDFNATLEHTVMRHYTDLGLTSGAVQAGSGWQPTFDADRRPLPPLITIDHALVNDRVVAQQVRTVAVDGTDHRGLVVDVTVR